MIDPKDLKGFQLAAFNAIESLDPDHAALLTIDWPTSLAETLSALISIAGMPRGTATNVAAGDLWKLAPTSTTQASASMQLTVAMPAQPVKDANEQMFGMWASQRQQRDSRYANLMKGNLNVRSFSYLGDSIYFMFSDLAAIIPTAEALADAVAKGLFEIEDDDLRMELRQWRRARAKGNTMDLSDGERDENWEALGTLLTPAFRSMLGDVATIYEARLDMVAFDDKAIRQATGGASSVARLSRTIMAAAQHISDHIKLIRDKLDSQVELRDEIDGALKFLRHEEVQRGCGVKEWTEETADAGVAKVLARFGNKSGAPAIQLGYDYREVFLRLGDVLAQPDGVIDPQDLFYIGEAASSVQSDAAFVEFGFSNEDEQEDSPTGKPFHAEPVGLAPAKASTGFTRKWQVWFLKAKLDFGFSFSESRE